jgi:hypothetical protein
VREIGWVTWENENLDVRELAAVVDWEGLDWDGDGTVGIVH